MTRQNLQAEGATEWPDSFIGYDIWFDQWPTEWRLKCVTLDPSKGTDAKFGDYSAFVMLMRGRNGLVYVDADVAVRNTALIVDTSLEIRQEFGPDGFCVEVNQFPQLLADELQRVAGERGMPLPLYTVNNQVNKQVRVRRLAPYLAQKLLRFKGGSKGARLLVDQLRDFPCGDHDDGPDALEMAVRMAEGMFA